MSQQTLFNIMILVGAITVAVSSFVPSQTISAIMLLIGAVIVAVCTYAKDYYMKKEADKQEVEYKCEITELQNKLDSIGIDTSIIPEMSNNIKIILSTKDKTGPSWKEIRMIDFAVWFGGEGIDYFYLIFKSTSGIIKGKVRIKGAGDEIHPFSTQVNSSVPIPLNNLLIKEKGHYQKFPTIEYTITEKSNFDATLTIVMTDIHAVGERTTISLQRPPSIKEK